MQASTHFLVGILCAKWIETSWGISNIPLQIAITLIISFLLHYPVDFFVYITYHPKEAHPKDKFWVGYHLIMAIFTLILAIAFWNPFVWVMISSVLVDIIDWIICRAILHKKPIFHPWIEKTRDKYFLWIPNNTEKRSGVLIEAGLVCLLFLGIFGFF